MNSVFKACPIECITTDDPWCVVYDDFMDELKELSNSLRDVNTGCVAFDGFIRQLKETLPYIAEEFGTRGPALIQLRPDSDFFKKEVGETPKGTTNYVIIAGNKPPIPPWLKGFGPLVGKTIEHIFDYCILDIPDSVKETFEDLILYTFKEGTDGIVPIDSAMWTYFGDTFPQDNPPPAGGSQYSRMQVPLIHLKLLSSEVSQNIILRAIKHRQPYNWAVTGSPVNLYVYDQFGNLAGLKEGEVWEKIDNAKFFIDEDNVQSIFIDDDKEYTYIIEATDNGSFSFSASQIMNNKNIFVSYRDVNITDKSKASFKLAKDTEKYTLNVDLDGDGVVDKELEPDFKDIIDIEYNEINFTKSGTIETSFKKPFNKLWIFIPALIIVAGLFIFLTATRRHNY